MTICVCAEFWWTASCPMGWFWSWSVSVRPHSIPSNTICSRRPENILSITSCRRRPPTSLSVLHRWELGDAFRWVKPIPGSVADLDLASFQTPLTTFFPPKSIKSSDFSRCFCWLLEFLTTALFEHFPQWVVQSAPPPFKSGPTQKHRAAPPAAVTREETAAKESRTCKAPPASSLVYVAGCNFDCNVFFTI